MTKVYCRDCKNYWTETLTDRKIELEFCEITVDDHASPVHQVRMNPAVLNEKNDCPWFEPKSGK